MSNYYRTILINIHRIIYYILKIRLWMRHPERHSEEERYAVAKEMILKMNRSAGYDTIAYGTENLPKEGGYVLYPNHQGKYDVPGIIATHDKPVTFVMDEKRSHIILVNEFIELISGKRLVLNDPRAAITIFQQASEEIKQGRKYILFPEGGYEENNQNVLEAFKPGSFKLAQMAKCPIVPVALIDSYKVFNSGMRGPVTTYAYYLDPIPYEEYKSMKTKDIAEMVEKLITAKIQEHTVAAK